MQQKLLDIPNISLSFVDVSKPISYLHITTFKAMRYNSRLMTPRNIIYELLIRGNITNLKILDCYEEEKYLSRYYENVFIIVPNNKRFEDCYNNMDKSYFDNIFNKNYKIILFDKLLMRMKHGNLGSLCLQTLCLHARSYFMKMLQNYKMNPNLPIIIRQNSSQFVIIEKSAENEYTVSLLKQTEFMSKYTTSRNNIKLFQMKPLQYIKTMKMHNNC